MAVYNFQKQDMVAGERRVSDNVVMPAGLTSMVVELTMNAAEMRDPATDAEGVIEFFDATIGDWRLVASTRLVGNPSNNVSSAPYVTIGAQTLAFLVGKTVRGVIVARSAGRYGGTVTTT